MRAKSKSTMKLVTILLASAALGLAQTSGYPTYKQAPAPVQPGALNYVEGDVSVDGQAISQQAVGSLTLRPGQDLKTGNGYAEVLLTPGAFLRVGNGTEIQMETAGLANTRVRFLSGDGLLEVDQLVDGVNLSVDLNQVTSQVEKKGLYDFEAGAQNVRVLDGKLKVIGNSKTVSIGKGDEVMLANGDGLKKTDFSINSLKTTPLYAWSASRSQTEAQENGMAARNASYYASAGPGWFWDPYSNYYGFWPASAYLYSPFGFGFYSPLYFGYYGGYHGFYRGGYRGGVALYRGGAVGHVSGFRGGGGFHGGGGGGHR
jgi:hypothetical protein